MRAVKQILIATVIGVSLSACSDNASTPLDADIESKLNQMSVSETFDYLEDQTLEVTDILKTVTDENTAKAAIKDLQAQGPKLMAALKSFETIDESELSIGVMRKLPALFESQKGLLEEFSRIQENPEARKIIQDELDKLNLGDLRFDDK